MKDRLSRSNLQIRSSNIDGYGVFSLEDIPEGQIIEEVPVLLLDKSSVEGIGNYTFSWGDSNNVVALPAGHGFVFNHGEEANARYRMDENEKTMIVTAAREIKAGEEILIHYGNAWFDTRGKKPIKPNNWRWIISREVLWIAGLFAVFFFMVLNTKA